MKKDKKKERKTFIVKELREQTEMVPVVIAILEQKAKALKEAKKRG